MKAQYHGPNGGRKRLPQPAHLRRLVATLVLGSALLGLQAPTAALAAPATPSFGPGIDDYAGYVGQTFCDPTPKPGVVDFKNLLNEAYGSHWSDIDRDCNVGDQSEHKEGRALDYGFDYYDEPQRADATDLLNWLLTTDQYGNAHAMARRLGVMYIIWNRQIWEAYRPGLGWQPYSCDGTHNDCHTNHIHFSFSWAGAYRETSWWTSGGAATSLSPILANDGGSHVILYRWYSTGSSFGSYSTATHYSFDLDNVGDRVAAGDVNGDGKDDMVMAYQNADTSFTFKVFLNGTTAPANWYTSGPFNLAPVGDRLVLGTWL